MHYLAEVVHVIQLESQALFICKNNCHSKNRINRMQLLLQTLVKVTYFPLLVSQENPHVPERFPSTVSARYMDE